MKEKTETMNEHHQQERCLGTRQRTQRLQGRRPQKTMLSPALFLLLLSAAFLVLLQPAIAANDPGHDTLYVLRIGDTNVSGSINVTSNFTAASIRYVTLLYGNQLNIRSNGTIIDPDTDNIPAIQSTTSNLYLDANTLLLSTLKANPLIQIGSASANDATLNVSGTIKQQNVNVCLQNGSNCPGGSNTGNVTSLIAGNGISVSAATGDVTVGTSATTCGASEYSYWDGNSWECRADESAGDGTGGWTDTPTTVSLTDNTDNVSIGTAPTFFVDNTNLRVGMGTTTPQNRFHITPTTGRTTEGLQIGSSNDQFVILGADFGVGNLNPLTLDGDGGIFFSNGTKESGSFIIAPWSDSTAGLRITSTGNVGIGSLVPTQKLHVEGSANITGTIYQNSVAVCLSDGTNCPSSGGNVSSSTTSTDNAIARYDGATGLIIQNSAITISDNGNLAGVGNITTGSIIQIGSTATSTGTNTIAVGTGTTATGLYGLAAGYNAKALNNYAIAIGYNAYVNTSSAVAIGYFSNVSGGNNGVAIGQNAYTYNGVSIAGNAAGDYGVSIGHGTGTSADYAVAIGYLANASGYQGAAVGWQSQANESGSTAYGTKSRSLASGAIAIGHEATSAGIQDISIGYNSNASGTYGVAIGYDAEATGSHGITIGRDSRASAAYAQAFGAGANATHAGSIAIGRYATTTAANQLVIGNLSHTLNTQVFGTLNTSGTIRQNNIAVCLANGTNCPSSSGNVSSSTTSTDNAIARYDGATGLIIQNSAITISDNGNLAGVGNITTGDSFFIGSGAEVSGIQSVSIGYLANVTGLYGTALGASATSAYTGVSIGFQSNAGSQAVAIGDRARAFTQSAAIGTLANTTGNYAYAFGGLAKAGLRSVALGYTAQATGADGVALGYYANSSHTSSIAIGRSATTTADNQLVIGNLSYTLNTQIFGTLNTTGNLYENNERVCTASNGLCGGSSGSGWTNTSTTIYLVDSNDDVGIGTSSPGAKLDVLSTTTLNDTNFTGTILSTVDNGNLSTIATYYRTGTLIEHNTTINLTGNTNTANINGLYIKTNDNLKIAGATGRQFATITAMRILNNYTGEGTGEASALSGTVNNYGIYAETAGNLTNDGITTHYGAYLSAKGGSDTAYGIIADARDAATTYGISTSATGSTTTFGIYSSANSATTNYGINSIAAGASATNYGIYAGANSGTNNYGAYLQANSGTNDYGIAINAGSTTTSNTYGIAITNIDGGNNNTAIHINAGAPQRGTNNYSIYSASNATSWFNGSINISDSSTLYTSQICLSGDCQTSWPSGSGNVSSSTTSTDNAIARWDGTTGFVIQNSGVTVSDQGNLAGIANITTGTTISIGSNTISNNTNSIGIGTGTKATASNSLAIGDTATASGIPSAAFGYLATASGGSSAAIGDQSVASGTPSIAMGYQATASGAGSIALGPETRATNTTSIAIGRAAKATGEGTMALGYYANASFNNSVAIGQYATTTAANQLVIGNLSYSLNTKVFGSINVSGPGNIHYQGNLTGYGADLAELVHGSGVGPGDVVILDPSNDEAVIKSIIAYDTRVAGIVSTDPSHLMSADKGNIPLALAGRVPVKVTSENGAVKRGDLLTTSSTPGHAMRCASRSECSGAIVGKAMEEMQGEQDTITALVVLG